MTQEPECVIEESQLRKTLLKAYELKCAEVESLTARLAAQSGYAEDEELAALREDKARLDWLSMNLPFDVWHDIDIHDLAAERIHSDDEPEMYAAYAIAIREMIDTVREIGLTHHNPRKGAE